ncbi:response regulator transcription factor [Azospirillum canadense]|uniref:response regulator transcription factor n=1 Tax=Azospirillum canadense TaxID=403962 RepID=UPI002226BBE8|nr:response regulator transcription factor [Azospirillum canadense]MCW2236377.1 DNA-binding NarL/FixJ family response regulator [Azospirillum canadense]
MKTVLIVDDHRIVIAGCRRLLSKGGEYEVLDATTAEEAFALCDERQPDVVVLDLGLPGIGGLEVLRKLLEKDPRCRVMIFSMHDDLILVSRALQTGAKGYLTKNDAPEELIVAVEVMLAGGTYLSHAMARELAVLNHGPGRRQDLTPRELDVLRLLGQGLILGDIAERLGISYKTVANTCTQMKDKLTLKNTRELIRFAIEQRFDL